MTDLRQDTQALIRAMRRTGLTAEEAVAHFHREVQEAAKEPPGKDELEARAYKCLLVQTGLAQSLLDSVTRTIEQGGPQALDGFQERLKRIVRAAAAVERMVPLLVDLRDVRAGEADTLPLRKCCLEGEEDVTPGEGARPRSDGPPD